MRASDWRAWWAGLWTQGPDCLDEVSLLARAPQRLLFIRMDSIGDGVMAAGMIPPLHGCLPDTRLTVLCQPQLAPVFSGLPGVVDVITVDKAAYKRRDAYRKEIRHRLAAGRFNVALNTVCSREPVSDELVRTSGAPVRIGFTGDASNHRPGALPRYDRGYTHLFPIRDPGKPELLRHAELLRRLGLGDHPLQATFPLAEADRAYAEALFARESLDPATTVALFPGAQHAIKFYEGYGAALDGLVGEEGLTVLLLGGPGDREIGRINAAHLHGRVVDLMGATSLGQTAALLARCRLAVGADTALAHLSCAVGTPNVIVLGGGHFGRFLPYSPLTSVVCRPLACYGCNWACTFERAHCIQDLPPALVERAIREAWAGASDRPRVYVDAAPRPGPDRVPLPPVGVPVAELPG